MSNQKPMIVMPAVYRFSFEDMPEQSKWGWHKAWDIWRAANNILTSKGLWTLTQFDMVREYPWTKAAALAGIDLNSFLVADKKGFLWTYNGLSDDWLYLLCINHRYLPAKLGMLFLNGIKHPFAVG